MERSEYQIDPKSDRKNLVVIVVDALRPDHLGIFGYRRDTTPNLRALQKSGMMRQVSGMRSSCTQSRCGLLSLTTSKFVHQLSNRPFTLQQILKRHGYRIHMILGGDHTNFYGLKEHYGDVDSYFDGSQAIYFYFNDDRLVVDRAKSLAEWDGNPVMFQFHLMSAHVMGKRHDEFIRYRPAGSYVFSRNRDDAWLERSINYYDNGVLQSDAIIHELLEILKAKKFLDNSLVVITSDHGEEMGERGMFGHGNRVYDEVLRISFVLLSYGYAPPNLHDHRHGASQVDIARTILEEFGMIRPSTWAGSPLQKSARRRYTYFQEDQEVGLIDNRDQKNVQKFWINIKSGEERTFNLSVYSKERHNAIASLQSEYLQSVRSHLMELNSVAHRPR